MRAITLGFHDVLDLEQVNAGDVYTIRLRDFCEHLRAIEHSKATISTIDGRGAWGSQVPTYITFDDGTAGAYIFAASWLEKHCWRAHFFITTDWIGRDGFMTRHQVRELHMRGHVIGSHSCSHPERMSQLSRKELIREWGESCSILGDILGSPVRTASVAGGYYSRKVAEAAATTGIEVLFTSEPTSGTVLVDGCQVLGRYSIQSFTAPAVTGAIVARYPWPRWKQSLLWDAKKIVKAVGGETYVTLRRQLLSRLMAGQKAARP